MQLQNLRSDEALERCLKDAEKMVLGARTTDSLLSSASSVVDSPEPCSKRAYRQSVILNDSVAAAPAGCRSAHDSVFRRAYFEAIDIVLHSNLIDDFRHGRYMKRFRPFILPLTTFYAERN